ncbi:BBSome-interacting protein 1-like [Haliotis asinina]|uniref:BBSome-interacting protein 1-like n=1 Tax=Haliotis asinina TaxID=109174 RepID=UPI0035327A05
MPETAPGVKEVLPKQGLLYQEDMPTVVLCKPKLLPLKSVTLEKMEKMQKEAQDLVKQQDKEAEMMAQMGGGGFSERF